EFPDARVPEVAQHVVALRAMHEQLDGRFAELVREPEETAALIETMTNGVLAADTRGAIVTLNRAARWLLGYGADDPLPALAGLFHEKAARDLVETLLAGGDAEPHELERGGRALLATARATPGSNSRSPPPPAAARPPIPMRCARLSRICSTTPCATHPRAAASRCRWTGSREGASTSRWRTRARGSGPSTCPAFSSAFTAPTPAGRARRGAPGWAWRSSSTSSRRMAGASRPAVPSPRAPPAAYS